MSALSSLLQSHGTRKNRDKNSLCSACLRVPFKAILQFLAGDNSVHKAFVWFNLPPFNAPEDDRKRVPVNDSNPARPFIRWHKDYSHLRKSQERCTLCYIVFQSLKMSHHYNAYIGSRDKKQLWLETPQLSGNSVIAVYAGKAKPEARISGNYRFTTTSDSPIANVFSDHVIRDNPLHSSVLTKMLSWLESCDQKHTKCAHAQELVPLPTRLLDLSPLPSQIDILCSKHDPRKLFSRTSFTLVEAGDGLGHYAALSYCWGKSLAYKTTRSNFQEHKTDGIQYEDIPRTLQDALFLVRLLGLRYVWIDCVCIVQDDQEDWEREAAQFGLIYARAYLTIAATRASHCSEGFLQPRCDKRQFQKMSYTEKGQSLDLYFVYDDLTIAPGSMESVTYQPLRLHRGEPLLQRVWCFQERVLASRTLHLASDQMYWECAERFEEERGVILAGEQLFYKEYSLERVANGLREASTSRNPDASRDAWFRLVREYTSREMTYQSDKLPAFSGVVSELEKQLPTDKCWAGIWRSWFFRGLLWRLQNPELDLYVTVPKQPSKDTWRAPSWSFASLEGVVIYDRPQDTSTICAQLLECYLTPKSQLNPLGALQSGHATIKAPVTSVTGTGEQVTRKGRSCMVRLRDRSLTAAAIFFDLDHRKTCNALMITPHLGLAIVPVYMGRGSYKRVGLISVQPLWDAVKNINLFMSKNPPDRFLSVEAYPEPRTVKLF